MSCGAAATGLLQQLAALFVVGRLHRVAVELEGAIGHLGPRAPQRVHLGRRQPGRGEQRRRQPILQREQLVGGAVGAGAADELAGGHVDDAGGEPHLAAGALVGADYDPGGADERAQANGADRRQVALLVLQLLLGDGAIEGAALDDAHAALLEVDGQRLADGLAHRRARRSQIGERHHRHHRLAGLRQARAGQHRGDEHGGAPHAATGPRRLTDAPRRSARARP